MLSREIVLPLPQNSVATGVVNVSASTKSHDSQMVRNGTEVTEVTEVSQFEASAKTYSQATLTNTERVIISNEPDACVERWILRSEIQKIFASRIAKIKDLVDMADKGYLFLMVDINDPEKPIIKCVRGSLRRILISASMVLATFSQKGAG